MMRNVGVSVTLLRYSQYCDAIGEWKQKIFLHYFLKHKVLFFRRISMSYTNMCTLLFIIIFIYSLLKYESLYIYKALRYYSRFFMPFFLQIRKKTPWTVQSHFENALLTYGKHSKNVKWIICRYMYHNNRLKLSARIPVVNFCSVTYFSFWKQFEGRFCDFGL